MLKEYLSEGPERDQRRSHSGELAKAWQLQGLKDVQGRSWGSWGETGPASSRRSFGDHPNIAPSQEIRKGHLGKPGLMFDV